MKTMLALLLASSMALAQVPAGQNNNNVPAAMASPQAAPDALMESLQTLAARADADVARLRVDKWKADAASKQQAQGSADSIRRNLENAVPELRQKVLASPSSLGANFRLYRNLNALYDAFSSLTESAGAFGSKEQYGPLLTDVNELDKLRRALADRVEEMTQSGDAELVRWRTQAAAAANAQAKPPSKIVVDDTAPVKTKKKKSSANP